MSAEVVSEYPTQSGHPGGGEQLRTRWRERVERLSDLLNPILVKEARQAAKSRMFVWPFGLMLFAALVWSYWCAASLLTANGPLSSGLPVFLGFVYILMVPALILVPYMAYQAIGMERQELTLDLIWITTLSGRQIVWGKFLGAILQLLAYTSALAPCLTFTYLLRGVDILSIILILFYTLLLSLTLTSFTIMLATAFRNAYLSMFTSAGILVLLVIAYLAWASFVGALLMFEGGVVADWKYFWPFNLGVTTISISFIGLFLLAAGAQMSFTGDNQSTLLRTYMLGQQLLFIFWRAYYLAIERNQDIGEIFPILGLYWAVMGAFMIGELAVLSPRARRSLPQTALGRVFLTWLQPGSGTGYVFTVATVGSMMAFFAVLEGILGGGIQDRTITTGLAVWCCVATYLGVSRLIVLWINRLRPSGVLVGFCVAVIIALAGVIIPTIATELSGLWRDDSALMFVNWAYVVGESFDPQKGFLVLVVVGPLAAVILTANLAFAVQEIAASRLPRY